MSEKPWTNMRIKIEKRKSTDSVQASPNEGSLLPNSKDTEIHRKHVSDINLKGPVTKEVLYPRDAKLQRSSTLFPAKKVKQESMSSEAPSEALKRFSEDALISSTSKKLRRKNSSEAINTITDDDCMIVENIKKPVQVEVIDLTEDSVPISPELCCPMRISDFKRILGKPNTRLQSNDVISKINCEVTTNKSAIDTNKNNYSTMNSPSRIQVNSDRSSLSKSINEVNYDQSSTIPQVDNQVLITAKRSNLKGNKDEVSSEKSRVVLCEDAHSKSCSINLRSELDQENENNKGVVDHVRVSNNIYACNAKNSTDAMTSIHQFADVSIKVEQSGNNVDCSNSTTSSNLSSVIDPMDFNPIDYPIKSEKNENCEVGKNFISVPNTSAICSTELGTESLSNVVNKQQVSPILDGDIYLNGLHLYKPVSFRTPLLKYLNCNIEVDIDEIACALSALNSIFEKEEINANYNNTIKSEVIPNPDDSQEKLEVCLKLKREEFSSPKVKEKNCLKAVESLDMYDRNFESCSNFKEVINPMPNVSNSVSPTLEKTNEEKQVTNSLKNYNLGDEMEQNIYSNILSEGMTENNEPNCVRESFSRTIFNSSGNTESLLENNYKNTISLPSLVDNKISGTSNNLQGEVTKNHSKKLLPYDFLRQIIVNAKTTEKSDKNISSSLKPSDEKVLNSNLTIDERLFQNLRQIGLIENKTVESMNSTSVVNENNSEHTAKISKKFSKSLLVPNENIFKQRFSHNPSTTLEDDSGTPSKRVKISTDVPISRSDNVEKFNCENCNRSACMVASPQYPQDQLLSKLPVSDTQSNLLSASPGSFCLEQSMLTPPENSQIHSLPIHSGSSWPNLDYNTMVNINYSHNPEWTHNYSPVMNIEADSQTQLGSFLINQMYPSQSAPQTTKSPCYYYVKQTPPVLITNATKNPFSVQSSTESFIPPEISLKIQQVNQMISEINSFHPLNFNQATSENDSCVLLPSSVSESCSSYMTQLNPYQSVQEGKSRQSLLSLTHLPGNSFSPSSQWHDLKTQESHLQISKYSAPYHDPYSSENVHQEIILNPPLPESSPPPLPPLPPTSPSSELTKSIVSNCSQNSLLHTLRKSVALKCNSSNFIFKSLIPKQLRKDIGRNIIHTNDVYLLIIERNIDWIHTIDKEIGGESLQVRLSYENHLMHYNSYFPLLLLECFSKISTSLKGAKREKLDKNICKIVNCETKQTYASFTCDSFIRQGELENIPKDGNIILVKFATGSAVGVKMLGFVCFSATRAYSHRHDHNHDILKYVNVNRRTELIKIKITFYIVFAVSGLNLDLPIEISKLTSIKKALMLNESLKELQRSPLCNAILNPWKNNVKSFTLPRRQDSNTMTTIVQTIVQSLNSLTPKMIVVESAPFTDSFLAIVQIVEEIQKNRMPGKILVCVRIEMLSQMGLNLVETSRNVVIINRERENVSEKLQCRILDVMATKLSSARNITDDVAKSNLLQEADVLLVVTGTCFYEDVQCMAKDLAYCIIHDAHSFTEPESLLPLLYGVRHLILFGYHEESCYVNSKRAASLGYNKSLFHRAYNFC